MLERKRSKSVIQEGGRVEGGCVRAIVEMSRQSKQDKMVGRGGQADIGRGKGNKQETDVW